MITLTREEAQQVLDALNSCDETWVYDGEDEQIVDQYDHKLVTNALETLRDKLSEPEPEPVAFQCCEHGDDEWFITSAEAYKVNPNRYKYRALYTAPPQREWVGLTDEETGAIMEELNAHGTRLYEFSHAVEAKLKEKNT
jgi:hypothetical protein